MKFRLLLLLLGFTLSFSQGLLGQGSIMVNRNYHGLSLDSLFKSLNSSETPKIYYSKSWISDVKVVQEKVPQDLRHILDKSLENSNFSYLIDRDNNIILLPQKNSQTTWQTSQSSGIETVRKRDDFKKSSAGIATSLRQRPIKGRPLIQLGKAGLVDKQTYELKGLLLSESDESPIQGGRIQIRGENNDIKTGTLTDERGFYEINLPKGIYEFKIEDLDLEPLQVRIEILGDAEQNFRLSSPIKELDEVLIVANTEANIKSSQMGVSRISIKNLKKLPTILGDVDVVKAAILLPGVQTVGEGSNGFNVRGGSADQNLLLLNQSTIFNPSHLFGFFSAFNPDMIESFDLYKSAIPARFGGRLSSVMDIQMRDGNKKAWEANAGISPITLRATLEGPIKKNKSSFLIGGRSTYSDYLLNRLENPLIRNSEANFYDLNAKISFKGNPKDQFEASFYTSRDFFLLNGDTSFTYRNFNGTLNWKHFWNSRLLASNSLIYSEYNYDISTRREPSTNFDLEYRIRQVQINSDWSFKPAPKHQLNWGISSILYSLSPGSQSPRGSRSLVVPVDIETEQALESAIYFSEEYDLNTRIKLYGGLRFSLYNFLGPQTVYNYLEGSPLDPSTIVDSTTYNNGELIKTYGGPELRLSSRILLDENSSLKIGFHRMRQYLHVLSNTTSFAPTDTWKLSDPFIRPQVSDQLAVGYFRNFQRNAYEASVELYIKRVNRILDFKGGAQLVLNPFVETGILAGEGQGYGAEFLLRKNKGKLTGWVSYTYARIFTRIRGDFIEETINDGDWFPATVDKPHDFSLVGNYRFSRRFSISTNVAYSTGRPITFPVGQFQLGSSNILSYSLRNQFRIPDYFRWDLAANFEGNHKVDKLIDGSWSFSIYNVLGRRNPFSIFFVTGTSGIQGYRLSIFGRPILTLTYNVKIK
ncbi:MAG: TonB-dependent receptor [Bacteroidia bacterium]|nr:TonB-dependent receptor [Bacteroidia bacterium]